MADERLPDPVTVREGETPDLPDLPSGYVWRLDVTATADVIHPDGSVN